MLRVDENVLIQRAPEDVFEYITDMENTPIWLSSVVNARWIDPGEIRVGRRGEQTYRFLGRKMEFIGETTTYDPPKQIAFKTVEGPFAADAVFRCEPEGDGCRLSVIEEFPQGLGGVFGKLAEPLVNKLFARELRADLENLKDILEAGAETHM